MSYTLGTAAKAAGRSKATILKAIRNGKVSAEKNAHGYWSITPEELHRVYPIVDQEVVTRQTGKTTVNPEINTLKHRVELLEAELQAERRQNKSLEGQVVDLKDRSDDLRSDRDAWREQVQRKLLTWRGLFGGGKAE